MNSVTCDKSKSEPSPSTVYVISPPRLCVILSNFGKLNCAPPLTEILVLSKFVTAFKLAEAPLDKVIEELTISERLGAFKTAPSVTVTDADSTFSSPRIVRVVPAPVTERLPFASVCGASIVTVLSNWIVSDSVGACPSDQLPATFHAPFVAGPTHTFTVAAPEIAGATTVSSGAGVGSESTDVVRSSATSGANVTAASLAAFATAYPAPTSNSLKSILSTSCSSRVAVQINSAGYSGHVASAIDAASSSSRASSGSMRSAVARGALALVARAAEFARDGKMRERSELAVFIALFLIVTRRTSLRFD